MQTSPSNTMHTDNFNIKSYDSDNYGGPKKEGKKLLHRTLRRKRHETTKNFATIFNEEF